MTFEMSSSSPVLLKRLLADGLRLGFTGYTSGFELVTLSFRSLS